MGHFFNAIRHHDGCRLVHPAKWDIGKFRGAFVTDADWCIPSGDSFIYQPIHIYSIFFNYHISVPISLSYYLFKDILNLCTYFIYSFTYIHSYTHSHIHSCILIHVYSFINSFTYTHSYTHSRILIHTLIHIFIHVYSFINSFTYTHSRILIHILIHILMLISYTHSHTHPCILIHVYTHLRIFLSFVIIFWLYVIIIIYHLTTLCVHDILPFMFTFMFQFIFIFIFHIIFMFHEHIYTFFIFYFFLVSCLLHMALPILIKYDVYEITPHSRILIPL